MPAPLTILQEKIAGPWRPSFANPACTAEIPGRVDVLGGLAAETGGTLAQMHVPRRAAVAAALRSDDQLIIHSGQIAPPLGESPARFALSNFFRDAALRPARDITLTDAPWAAPLVALWYVLSQSPAAPALRGPTGPRGLTLGIESDIPLGAGQASSTAILAAALQAIAAAVDCKFEDLDAALLIQRAENLFGNASAHVVDALTCLTPPAPPPALLRYSAQPHTFIGRVPLPKDLRLVALDTGLRYTAAGNIVSALRLAGSMGLRIIETIYRDLGQRHTPLHGYLANVSPSLYRQYFRSLLPKRLRGSDFLRTFGPLPERSGVIDPQKLYRVRTAVDHLVSEHEHAENFLQTIEDLAAPMTRRERHLAQCRAGRLLLASQHSYRLRLELSCREADWLVDRLMESGPQRGLFGARITATGGGGTVVALTNRSSAANDVLLDTMKAYQQLTGVQLSLAECL